MMMTQAGGSRTVRFPPAAMMLLLLLGGLVVQVPARALQLDVKVEGVEGQERSNVLALLGIYQEHKDPDLTLPRMLALHRRAAQQIAEALAPFGYYRVQVDDSLTEPAQENGTWVAQYRIDRGAPVRIGQVHYEVTGAGAENPAFPSTFPMKVGDVLLHSAYEKAKSDLRYTASAQGYLDYSLERHQVLIDPVAYDALVDFELETGPQYFIGPVHFRQDLLSERLLERYVTFRPGAVYDPSLLLDLQGRLLSTEYYSDVEIVPRKEEAGDDHEIPIDVVATRNKANKYRIGLGYATDVGPRFSTDWSRRYLNREGHKLRTELSVAPNYSYLNLDYRIPVRDPTRDYLIFKPEISYYDNATRQGWMYSLQGAYSMVTGGGWRRTVGVDYSYEDIDISDDESTASNELVPSISWSKTVADDPINTRRGYSIKYTVLGALDGVVSSASYLSASMQFKWIRSFAKDYRFIARTSLGATLASSVEDLPASRRFYAGGDNSIRGWGYDALGPNDDNDETVGGRYLAVGSLEIERTITGPWSVAAFTDFGNAFDPDYSAEFEESVGIGVRWASPIGRVRLDLAFALTKDDGDDSSGLPPARLHIVIGPDL